MCIRDRLYKLTEIKDKYKEEFLSLYNFGYFAPEILINIRRSTYHKLGYEKFGLSDIFSLGLTLLSSLIAGEISNQVYGERDYIDDATAKQAEQEWFADLQTKVRVLDISIPLQNLLIQMVDPDPNTRINAVSYTHLTLPTIYSV
eukprot:TRINITY_DN16031_c0_g1_i1.p1 TRINITY_DN16031_c0_g1~~TRINITY_DN16031_c0_g1_i1.p1  ORF type:complete len:164 (+),score=32.25 TRINITY_DN16031_c0_g1_i1:60-494(+)